MTLETMPPDRSRLGMRWSSVGFLALALAGTLAMLALLSPALRSPGFVDRVAIHNPHPWHARVEVSDPERQGWVALGTVRRGRTETFHDVVDQGGTWVFRFSYGGHDGGELVVERIRLQQANWTVTVVEEFAERMRRAGVGESAG